MSTHEHTSSTAGSLHTGTLLLLPIPLTTANQCLIRLCVGAETPCASRVGACRRSGTYFIDA